MEGDGAEVGILLVCVCVCVFVCVCACVWVGGWVAVEQQEEHSQHFPVRHLHGRDCG